MISLDGLILKTLYLWSLSNWTSSGQLQVQPRPNHKWTRCRALDINKHNLHENNHKIIMTADSRTISHLTHMFQMNFLAETLLNKW